MGRPFPIYSMQYGQHMNENYTVLVMIHAGLSITNGYMNKSRAAEGPLSTQPEVVHNK